MGAFAWVTMVTNDSYSLGALVLAHSLRRVATQADLAVLVTPGVTPSMREKLAAVYNVVREVNVLDSQDETNLSVLKRPELGITFTKLHCWRLTQYEKCVFLDADTLVVRNCDELFEREELSAARDVGWPDCFNSGVFVFKPSEQTFASITAFAVSQGSFDGADQGLLNSYFSDWGYKDMSKHLPFIYNMCSIATYSYPPAFKQFGANVKIIHFIGATKPWVQYFDTMTGIVQTPAGCEHLHPLLQLWWNIFCENVHPQLTDVMGGLAGALSKLTMGEYRTEEQRAIEDHMRKQNWEQGQIDFMGRDSFDNILKKINETLSTVPPVEESPVKETRQPKKTSGQSSKVEATVGESETSLPVLETEDQLKLYTTQELSEDKCQNISEDASSLIKYEQPITISSAISEVDNTSREKILASSQNILEEPEKSVPIAQSSDVPKNTAQESTESKTVLSEMNQDFQLTKTEESEVDKTQSKIDETIEKLVISADTTASILSGLPETEKIEVTSPTQETKPQIVSEATTECPVPIQVAESVLQAEPKESVSEDPRPIIEAVASSIIPSLQESATTISEALIQPDQNVSLEQLSQPQQINGHDPSLELYAEKNVSPAVNESLIICPNISSAVHESVVSQQQDNQSSIQQTLSESENKLQDLESGSAQSTDISLEKPELSTEKPKLTVVLPQTETTINKSSTTEPKLTVVLPQTETTINKSSTTEPTQVIQSEPSTDIEPVAADSGAIPVLLTKEPPVRPIRSKDLKIPGTPTVTEPTPPTSPPVETGTTTVIEEKPQKETQQATEASIEIKIEVESTEKSEAQSQKPLESQQTAKKEQELAKKSSIESDTPSSPESEGSAKKVVKKKKVKKPEESGDSESSSSPGKPKKGTKTGKKLAKIPSTSLETDTTVPETSPPSQSSDAPVPPKRKSKSSSSTKVIDKKSDEPTKQ